MKKPKECGGGRSVENSGRRLVCQGLTRKYLERKNAKRKRKQKEKQQLTSSQAQATKSTQMKRKDFKRFPCVFVCVCISVRLAGAKMLR